MIDRPVAENIIEADSGLEISGGIETEEQYGFVVQQGDEELLDELNEGLKEVIDSGEYKTIYKKWFHKPVPAGDRDHDPRSDLSRPAESRRPGKLRRGARDGAPFHRRTG